jgi:type VI secretion system secreted protein Hcp
MALVAGLPADCFLFIKGTDGSPIKGDSQDSAHPNEVQVYSYDIGASGGSGTSGAPGNKTWKADPHPAHFTIAVGRASPFLVKAAWCGDVFKEMTLSLRKPGAPPEHGDYMQWRFGTVQVTSYSQTQSAEAPTETIEISYQQIEMYYARQGQKGSLKDDLSRGFSFDSNKTFVSTLPYIPKPQTADK